MTDCDGKHYWLINSAGTHGVCQKCGAERDFPPSKWTEGAWRQEVDMEEVKI